MSEPTPTPSTALSSLRHLYQQMVAGTVKYAAEAKRIATGLLGPAIEKLEAASRAPVETADESKTLWCVHLTGADDVHPMPSREVALEEANSLNTSICRIKREDVDPVLIAVVTEWPHSADSHGAGLMIRDECLRMRATQVAPQPQVEPAGVVPCGVCGADDAFTGTCGGGRSNPRALCFESAAIATTQSARHHLPPVTPEEFSRDIAELMSAQPAPAGEYPALPLAEYKSWANGGLLRNDSYTAEQMRAYADATHAMRAGEQEPVADSFREWFAKNYPTDTIILDPDWHARSIYRMAMAHARLASPVATQGDQLDAKRWQAATRNHDICDVAVYVVDEFGDARLVEGEEADAAIDAAIAVQAKGGA